MPTGSDRIAYAVLMANRQLGRWAVDDIVEILELEFGDDAPTRRTVLNRLEGLEEVGVVESAGGPRRTMKLYREGELFR